MACNMCGGTVDLCDNENCLNEIEGGKFYCHGGAHFCSVCCWKIWIVVEERENLEEAIDDEKQ